MGEKRKKVILIITDGIGFNNSCKYNAFCEAIKPAYNYLFENVLSYPIKKNTTPKWDGDGVDYNVTLSDNSVIKFKYDNTPSSGCLFKCVSNCDKIGE